MSDYDCSNYVGRFRQDYPEFRDRFIFLFLGRINYTKGLDLLSQAFGKVAYKYPHVALAIAGPDDNGYQEKVRNWLADLGVLDKVLFTGLVSGEKKLAVLADANAFVSPSYSENFGFSIVEAMACKLPVIVSDQVNISDDIKTAHAGLVVPTRVEALAQAMESAINMKEFSKLGENGHGLVAQKYTWDRVIDKMIEIYRWAISVKE